MQLSIIIPCYNGEEFLDSSIRSALRQSYRDLEVIVVDDGSIDGSAAVVSRYPEVKLIQQKNAGVSAARNTGLNHASGDLVIFLDADDQLLPNAAALSVEAFEQSRARVMVFGGNRIINQQGAVIGTNPQARRTFLYREVLLGVTPGPSQCMFRSHALRQVEGFNPSIKWGEDWDLYLRLAKIGQIFCHGEIVSDYRIHPLQSTRNPSAALKSMLNILQAHEAIHSKDTEKAVFEQARRRWRFYFGQYIPSEAAKSILKGDFRTFLTSSYVFTRHMPHSAAGFAHYVHKRAAAHRTFKAISSRLLGTGQARL